VKDNLPPWNCRNAECRARFEAWTNEQLDCLEEESLMAAGQSASDLLLFVRLSALDAAIARGEVDAAVAMLADEGLLRHDTQRRTAKRRGRPLGWTSTRFRVARAAAEIDCVREIWRAHYGRCNRTMTPKALDIVVRRFEASGTPVSRAAIEDHRRKHRRFRPE
jgi:hypothetical protein